MKMAEMRIPPHLQTVEREGLARICQASHPESFRKLSFPKDSLGIVLKVLLKERQEGR
jgi:hypothetical protein